MTKRLYYDHPELLEFDSTIEDVHGAGDVASSSRPAVILRESAFYPTSGGQVHDTGWLTVGSERFRVTGAVENDSGAVVHYLDAPAGPPAAGSVVRGVIDSERRRDHMQQHSGQHVLSAAFIELYQMPTVSFHMGEDYCSIDLAVAEVRPDQLVGAEGRANEIIFENRPVGIRYVSRAEAEKLGLRKLPPAERDELRLIEIANFDLSACGGTHVAATGQIGSVLLRKSEKVRQGTRVEFVCGWRALRAARRDYTSLTEAAALFSSQPGDVPEMIRKTFEEGKALRRQRDDAVEELAAAMARESIGRSGDRAIGSSANRAVVVRTFSDRDISFAKLFAQKATRLGVPAIALVGSTVSPPGLVFAQTAGGASDMGALLKQVLAEAGGRGGGSRDFAQGGVPAGANVEDILRQAAGKIA
jgi:alanyl-tRNA synthetase